MFFEHLWNLLVVQSCFCVEITNEQIYGSSMMYIFFNITYITKEYHLFHDEELEILKFQFWFCVSVCGGLFEWAPRAYNMPTNPSGKGETGTDFAAVSR